MKQGIWLAFDLGLQGDYQGLYTWLDSLGAAECGDNIAFIRYTFAKDLKSELLNDIGKTCKLDNRTRMYLVYRNEGKFAGTFIVGSRKGTSPWAGYAPKVGEQHVDST